MENTNKTKKRNYVPLIILGAVLIVGGIFGYKQYDHKQHFEDTENAQIEGNISPVLPRIAGYVTQINVKENQMVKQGDVLVKLDDRELQVKVEQAEAAIQTAIANLKAVEAGISTAGANVSTVAANLETSKEGIDAAQVRLDKAQLEYNRYSKLLSEKSTTQAQFDNVEAEKRAANVQLEIAKRQLEAARQQLNASKVQADASKQQIAVAKANIAQRQADLEMAKLQLTYSVIYAPATGKVSKKNVQTGQFVQAGQSLMNIVVDEDVWVVANFKETQMGKMHEGQPVKLEVDMYPDIDFDGKVESISGATGAKFALLPPDNASGNFVKVVQRIPVKIVFANPNPKYPLRAGMNVDVEVKVN